MSLFHSIQLTSLLCLTAGLLACSCVQTSKSERSLPECYLSYTHDMPPSPEPPPVLRLNADECRELLSIESATVPDTPMKDWQVLGGSPVFYILDGKQERTLYALSTVKNLTAQFIPEAAANRFFSLVKAVEARPEARLQKQEAKCWRKKHIPIFMYQYYYKD